MVTLSDYEKQLQGQFSETIPNRNDMKLCKYSFTNRQYNIY